MNSFSKFLAASAVALAMAASSVPASAAVVLSFGPGDSSPGFGFTVIDTFDDLSGVTVLSPTVLVQVVNNRKGAPPANSNPLGTSYLSVLRNGSAFINFSGPVRAFQFDWGSIDRYNTLTIHSGRPDQVIVPGTLSFPNLANGDQAAIATNGLFTVVGTAGETFTGITLASSKNSFEIDNLAVGAIPEPGTWALRIGGFAGAGAMLRRRRSLAAVA